MASCPGLLFAQRLAQFAGDALRLCRDTSRAVSDEFVNGQFGLNHISTTMQQDDIDESFSRAGSTHPLGTFDAELGRVNMHSETIDILRGMAAKQGLPLAEFVRFHLDVVAYGVEGVQRMHADRIKRMASNVGV